MYLQKAYKNDCIKINQKFIISNCQYETIMGSFAYGVSNELSDLDILGFCIPPKDYVFPHLRGEIIGFSTPGPKFEQYQNHHVMMNDVEYDFTIYNIIKYFRLCMDNNPNMIDSLFTPFKCVTHITNVGKMVRENRKLFLSKKCYHSFKGYAYSQINKARTKKPIGKRKEHVEKYGWDTKFGYHTIRLVNECEQILSEGDIDLTRNNKQLKFIKEGGWSFEKIYEHFEEKEKHLEELYRTSSLPYKPREKELTELLLNCLEEHYGKLDNMTIQRDINVNHIVEEIKAVISKYE